MVSESSAQSKNYLSSATMNHWEELKTNEVAVRLQQVTNQQEFEQVLE